MVKNLKLSFLQLINDFGIKRVSTMLLNPESNGVCERMYQIVGSVLHNLILQNEQQALGHVKILVKQTLATEVHAVRTNTNQTAEYSSGKLAFHRDMLLNMPLVVDLLVVRDRRQLQVDKELQRTNSKRSSFDYEIGMQKINISAKMAEKWKGPFKITRVHVNDTITICLSERFSEKINIY